MRLPPSSGPRQEVPANDFGSLLSDQNAHPGSRGAGRVTRDPCVYRVSTNSLLESPSNGPEFINDSGTKLLSGVPKDSTDPQRSLDTPHLEVQEALRFVSSES